MSSSMRGKQPSAADYVDNGVITSASTTRNPKENATEMLCTLTKEQKQANSYNCNSPRLYKNGDTVSASTTAAPTHTPSLSPRSTL
jgi:hypothetical protein